MTAATKIEAAPTVYAWTPLERLKVGDAVYDGGHHGTVREIVHGGDHSPETEIRTEEGGTFFVPSRGSYAQVRVRTELEPGMGGTIWINGDAYPVTVRTVSKSGHRVEVSRDAVKGPGLFEPVDGERETFTRRKSGRYKPKGMEGIFLDFGRRGFSLPREV